MTSSLPNSIELSSLQRQTLEVIVAKGTSIDGHAWREQAILLWAEGLSASKTACALKVDENAVRLLRERWLSSTGKLRSAEKKVHDATVDLISVVAQILNSGQPWEQQKPASAPRPAADDAPQHNPTTARPTVNDLIEMVHNNPRTYGINRSNWTLRSLAEAFEKRFGMSISATTISRYLKNAGFSWKKSRKVLKSPDPKYREKVELVLETLQSLKDDEMFFFVDEMGPLQVKRYGGRCYTQKGHTPTHPQNARSKGSITLYAALSATTNQVSWFYGHTKDSDGIIDLIEILFNQYHNRSRLYITWDAASWHGSDSLEAWVGNRNAHTEVAGCGPIIDFVPLPSSSQFLNVIEAVFSGMKRAVIHFSDYQSTEEMKHSFREC